MPMLPGLAVFWAVFAFSVDEKFGDGLAHLLSAAATALALGSGVVMGELLGSPLRYRAGRIGDFFRKDGPPGLRRAVGRVVRLRPAETTAPIGAQRAESVPLEAAPDEESDPPGTDEVDDVSDR